MTHNEPRGYPMKITTTLAAHMTEPTGAQSGYEPPMHTSHDYERGGCTACGLARTHPLAGEPCAGAQSAAVGPREVSAREANYFRALCRAIDDMSDDDVFEIAAQYLDPFGQDMDNFRNVATTLMTRAAQRVYEGAND